MARVNKPKIINQHFVQNHPTGKNLSQSTNVLVDATMAKAIRLSGNNVLIVLNE